MGMFPGDVSQRALADDASTPQFLALPRIFVASLGV